MRNSQDQKYVCSVGTRGSGSSTMGPLNLLLSLLIMCIPGWPKQVIFQRGLWKCSQCNQCNSSTHPSSLHTALQPFLYPVHLRVTTLICQLGFWSTSSQRTCTLSVKSWSCPHCISNTRTTLSSNCITEGRDSPLLDNVVKLVAGFVVLQALHSVPLTLPIGFAELPNKHLQGGSDDALARAYEHLLHGEGIHRTGSLKVF